MTHVKNISAIEALEKLKNGNKKYVELSKNIGDVSPEMRVKTATNGQSPFAIVVACSDSRVIPETMFCSGLGDLFVIRVAGNVIDDHQLGSIEYAESHLGCRLVLVLGHTHCGAIDAAIHGNNEDTRFIPSIIEEIKDAIGSEDMDDHAATICNVQNSIHKIETSFEIQEEEHVGGLVVLGAIYDIETGVVEFLDQ